MYSELQYRAVQEVMAEYLGLVTDDPDELRDTFEKYAEKHVKIGRATADYWRGKCDELEGKG